MSRRFEMCDVCKLDRVGICDYKCIKLRVEFGLRIFTCPNFIWDDKNPMTNAELLSTDLKTDLEGAATHLWYKLIMDYEIGCGFDSYEKFLEWLKKEVVIE